jgi:hypothetical protein
MPILVVCPGCKKSWQVPDTAAGKAGPCPKCKTIIKVPAKGMEVKVHTPEEFGTGGKTVGGQLALKPIARRKVKFNPKVAAIVASAAVGMLVLAWIGNLVGLFGEGWLGYLGTAVGLLLVTPPLVYAGYQFLQDEESVPYEGQELYLRVAACSAAYIVLWGLFAYISDPFRGPDNYPYWAALGPCLLFVGTLLPMASLDLAGGAAFSHYGFYLIVTIVLRWAAGMRFLWEALPEPPV